jgi:hypothetical protein
MTAILTIPTTRLLMKPDYDNDVPIDQHGHRLLAVIDRHPKLRTTHSLWFRVITTVGPHFSTHTPLQDDDDR